MVLFRLIVCPESETADLVQTILKQTDPTEQNVIEFVETILVYKFPRLSREEIRTMLGFNNIELKQTRFYQEIAEEERQVAKNQLVLRLLEKRFSPLPSWVPDQLKQANDEQLDLLAERLLDAKTLAEVFH